MNKRIKMIRTNLGLTQNEFASKLGIVRNTIANYETGNRVPSRQIIISICREYNINENWLRCGEGEMYANKDNFSLDEYIKRRGGTELELEIIKTYFELDAHIRKTIINHFKEYFLKKSSINTNENISNFQSVAEKEEKYNDKSKNK